MDTPRIGVDIQNQKLNSKQPKVKSIRKEKLPLELKAKSRIKDLLN